MIAEKTIAEKTMDMIDVSINKDVLVIGAGLAGLDSAAKIAAQGYKVLIACKETEFFDFGDDFNTLVKSGTIEIMTQTELEDFSGVTGDFRATLVKGNEKIKRNFGAVIAAPNYSFEPLNADYGLSLNGKVVSQTMMEKILADPEEKEKLKAGKGSVIVFLSGLARETDPCSTERALRSILAVQDLDNCEAYFCAGNVKVASKGVERLFTKARHNGLVCFKPIEMPMIEQNQNSLKIIIEDPVIREDIELNPDYLVVDEILNPGQGDIDTATDLRIDTDINGFLPSNNVHRFPVNSNREGIFVVFSPSDASNVVLRVKELLGDGIRKVPMDRGVVDEKRCTICLTCYRCCPHGAIFWDNGAAVISSVACQGCGICASECPMDAIQIGTFTDDDLKKDIDKAIESAKNAGAPSIVAFCCKNSAFEAALAAGTFGLEMPAGFKAIKVPCAGKVDVEFIMRALVEGADGVMVAACHEGNCKAEKGNFYAKWRVNEISRRLEAMGINKDKVVFTNIASNMACAFADKVNDFALKLKP